MKILIVDDDINILKLYEAELKDEGYDVLLCTSGECALETFMRETPDIVTLDILMPGIDGITLLRNMKQLNPRVPIIMSTAFDYKDDFAVWASDAYLIKSLDTSELKMTIKDIANKGPIVH